MNWTRSSPSATVTGASSPPYGRCRQVLLDYFPTLKVIVGGHEHLRAVPIADLLPESYVWADRQLDAE